MIELTATPLAVFSVGAAVVSGILAWYGWQVESKPGATAFVGLMGAVAVWALLNAVNLVVHHPPSFRIRSGARWFVSAAVPVFGLAFALAYTGRDDLVSGWTMAALAVLPAVSTLVVLLGDPVGVWLGDCSLAMAPGTGVVDVTQSCRRGPLFWAHMTYAYTIAAIALALILSTVVETGSGSVVQAGALLLGAIVPFVANATWFLGAVPVPGFDPTPAAFSLTGVMWGYAVFNSQFLDVVPATRRIGQRTAIEDLKDGVTILDDDDRVISMNASAGEMFGCDPGQAVGRPVADVVGDDEFSVESGELVTELDGGEGRRTFEVTVSPLYDHQDQQIGHTLAFRDVTERRQRKQQLEALNRVLRHNLRNDMNVVKGYADTLAERTTDPEAGMAEFIAEQSSELVEVGSKVRDVERIMERRRSEFQRFDLRSLLRDAVEDVRPDYPEGRVVLQLPPDLWLRSDDLIVGTVVHNLVHNALEHNDADSPEVSVTASPGENGRWVDVVVTDNGPGIPQQERAALREGRETDLQHGSGLGLWVVNWGVTTLGGELAIEDADGGGTVVRVSLPGLTDPPESEADESHLSRIEAD